MAAVRWLLVIAIFTLGWLASSIYGIVSYSDNFTLSPLNFLSQTSPDVSSPSDWIKESQIHVFEDRIKLDIEDAMWSKFADTNSMDPFLDEHSNGIEIKPQSADQIQVGDIISFTSDYIDGIIIHRVIEKGEDSKGIYFKVKGDNNPLKDPGKIRFDQIQGVLVGILY